MENGTRIYIQYGHAEKADIVAEFAHWLKAQAYFQSCKYEDFIIANGNIDIRLILVAHDGDMTIKTMFAPINMKDGVAL